MTVSQLDANLEKILNDFSEEIRSNYHDSNYHDGSTEPITEHDINEFARQTFYAMNEFRKEIVKYLNEH